MEPKLDLKPSKSSADGAQGRQNGAKMAPRWGQDGEKIREKHQRNKEEGSTSQRPPPEPKKSPTWPQLRSQNGAKMAKKTKQKSIIFLMPLGIDLWVDFGYQNRAKLAPKWDQKSMLTPKGVFSKNSSFPNEQLSFFGSNASKLSAKTDQKSINKKESKMKSKLASNFSRFWSILGTKLG